MAAGGAERDAGGEDARTVGEAAIDGITEPDVDPLGGADVAHGREAGQQRDARDGAGFKGLLGGRGAQVVIFGQIAVHAERVGQMRVRVDQAGQQSGVAQIHDFRAGGRGPAHLGDLPVLNDDQAWRDGLVGSAVEQARGFQGHWMGLGKGQSGEQQEWKQVTETHGENQDRTACGRAASAMIRSRGHCG